MKQIFISMIFSLAVIFAQKERLTKMEYYQKYLAKPGVNRTVKKTAALRIVKEVCWIRGMLF